mmetsp:Transcript_42802/g.142462  ORF Transcript_42802/g.142462 Transcript_42802/m.142462 type:complete len:352 (-) Transcript_42802:52-1107(-)
MKDEASQRAAPWISLLDDKAKIVTSRLGPDRFRIAGTAEFNGYNYDIRQDRIDPLIRWCEDNFPDLSTVSVTPWAGLRPMMPSMVPRVGAGAQPGVFYNTGHGRLGWSAARVPCLSFHSPCRDYCFRHLGWTLSAATAEMVAEAVLAQACAPDHPRSHTPDICRRHMQRDAQRPTHAHRRVARSSEAGLPHLPPLPPSHETSLPFLPPSQRPNRPPPSPLPHGRSGPATRAASSPSRPTRTAARRRASTSRAPGSTASGAAASGTTCSSSAPRKARANARSLRRLRDAGWRWRVALGVPERLRGLWGRRARLASGRRRTSTHARPAEARGASPCLCRSLLGVGAWAYHAAW